MKKLGLIGGTGPEATISYYQGLTAGVQKKTGAFPPLVIESRSVFDVLSFCERKDFDGLASYLSDGISCLAAAGADFACFTGITPHVVFGKVQERSPIPLVSMMDTAVMAAKRRGFQKVVLLGTYPTMSGTFFREAFEKQGILVVTPKEEDMRYIGNKIETELEVGKVLNETRERLCGIAKGLALESGAGAVVLGCTELPMILNGSLLQIPCLDVCRIHIETLIRMICGEEVIA